MHIPISFGNLTQLYTARSQVAIGNTSYRNRLIGRWSPGGYIIGSPVNRMIDLSGNGHTLYEQNETSSTPKSLSLSYDRGVGIDVKNVYFIGKREYLRLSDPFTVTITLSTPIPAPASSGHSTYTLGMIKAGNSPMENFLQFQLNRIVICDTENPTIPTINWTSKTCAMYEIASNMLRVYANSLDPIFEGRKDIPLPFDKEILGHICLLCATEMRSIEQDMTIGESTISIKGFLFEGTFYDCAIISGVLSRTERAQFLTEQGVIFH